ncbi:MAG: HEAT repeat domain-containing protein [bacterium]|nr:HEAT repeat domain-containing protein [bacterium]
MAQDINKDIFSIKKEASEILSEITSTSFSLEKIEASANRLGEFGERALPFVARHLNKEKSDESISRLLYLIELLNDSSYTAILKDALSSGNFRESSLKTRVEIMATLKSYEITPFHSSACFPDEDRADAFITWAKRVLEDFQSREYRAISLLEEILLRETENRILIKSIAEASDESAVPLLSILAGSDKKGASFTAIKCLGRIKADNSVLALKELIATSWDKEIVAEANKAIRRLSFSGHDTGRVNFSPADTLPEGSRLYASPIDGLGNINLCIALNKGSGRFETTFLLLNDETGVIDAFGSSNMKDTELFDMLAETSKETFIKEVKPDYFFSLLNNALYLNKIYDIPLSPEFHYRKQSFNQYLRSKIFSPNFTCLPIDEIKRDEALINRGGQLFKKKEFEGWIISTPVSFDFAEKLSLLEVGGEQLQSIKKNKLVRDFCVEIIAPMKKQLSARLFMMADFYIRNKYDEETTKIILATALNLDQCDSYAVGNLTFLKVMAEKSMRNCIEALEEGFDLREFEYDMDELD